MVGTKVCTTCKIKKESTQFYGSDTIPGGLTSQCKVCKKRKRTIRVLRNKTYREEYLLKHPCLNCGERDTEVLEFDHRIPLEKHSQVSELIVQGRPIKQVKAEIDKCDVRCRNCHKLRTSKQQKWYAPSEQKNLYKRKYQSRNRAFVNEYLENEGCESCGITDPTLLESDHLDRKSKKRQVGHMVNASYSIDTIKEELDKCRVLCGNCHRKHTNKQIQGVA